MSVMGQKRKSRDVLIHVRFTPESGHSLIHGVHKVRASAKQVADVICGYPEIICGAMIARQIFDKLLALPTAITCDTDPADNPAENSTTKRKRLACIEFCGRLSLRIARHVNSQVDPERSFFAWPSCRQPIIARRCTVTRIAASPSPNDQLNVHQAKNSTAVQIGEHCVLRRGIENTKAARHTDDEYTSLPRIGLTMS
jgi:hypothetical protein